MKPEETSSRFDFSAHGRCRYNVGRIEQHSDARGCKHQLTQKVLAALESPELTQLRTLDQQPHWPIK